MQNMLNRLITKYGHINVLLCLSLKELKQIDSMSESEAISKLEELENNLKIEKKKDEQPILYYVNF